MWLKKKNPLWHYELVKLYKEGGENKGSACPGDSRATLFNKDQQRGGGEEQESWKEKGKPASLCLVIIFPVGGGMELEGDTGFILGGKHYLVQFHTQGAPLPTKLKHVGVWAIALEVKMPKHHAEICLPFYLLTN